MPNNMLFHSIPHEANMKIQLEFSEEQLSVLNMAINEIPYKLAAPLVQHINAQLKDQRMNENQNIPDKQSNNAKMS